MALINLLLCTLLSAVCTFKLTLCTWCVLRATVWGGRHKVHTRHYAQLCAVARAAQSGDKRRAGNFCSPGLAAGTCENLVHSFAANHNFSKLTRTRTRARTCQAAAAHLCCLVMFKGDGIVTNLWNSSGTVTPLSPEIPKLPTRWKSCVTHSKHQVTAPGFNEHKNMPLKCATCLVN